jgi:hypothetical protein
MPQMNPEERQAYKLAAAVILISVFTPLLLNADSAPRTVHVFTALCDNKYQGIVPVSGTLGNGDDPANNLYWGARYGVKTFFSNSPRWELVKTIDRPGGPVLERCVFRHKSGKAYLVADAYQGRQIRRALIDFLNAAAGRDKETVEVAAGSETIKLSAGGSAGLAAYVGHDGLMDFQLARRASAALDHRAHGARGIHAGGRNRGLDQRGDRRADKGPRGRGI